MNQPRHLILLLTALIAGALVLVGCQPAAETTAEPEAAEETAATPAPEPAGEIMLSTLSDSPQFPGAMLTLTAPAADRVEPGTVTLDFAVESFELGAQSDDATGKGIANSADGQHIHVIVDNGPYSAHYEPTAQIELDAGSHVVLAFLSRSYHESVKEPGAWVLRELLVGDAAESVVDASAPHLFYSRPKGTYAGADAERIMLDFYVLNAELSMTGTRVRVSVEGQEFTLGEWRPYVLEGLPDGEVDITLQLIDANGDPVPGPFNTVTRTIVVDRAG